MERPQAQGDKSRRCDENLLSSVMQKACRTGIYSKTALSASTRGSNGRQSANADVISAKQAKTTLPQCVRMTTFRSSRSTAPFGLTASALAAETPQSPPASPKHAWSRPPSAHAFRLCPPCRRSICLPPRSPSYNREQPVLRRRTNAAPAPAPQIPAQGALPFGTTAQPSHAGRVRQIFFRRHTS